MLRLHLITVAIAFGEFFGVFSPIIVVFVVIQIRPCGLCAYGLGCHGNIVFDELDRGSKEVGDE